MRKLQILSVFFLFVVINIYAADTKSDKAELLLLEKVWNDAHLNGKAEARWMQYGQMT